MASIGGPSAQIQLEGHNIEDIPSPAIETFSTPLSSPLPHLSAGGTLSGAQKHVPTSLNRLALRGSFADPNSVQLSPGLRLPLEYIADQPAHSAMSNNSNHLSIEAHPASSLLNTDVAGQPVEADAPHSAQTPRAQMSTAIPAVDDQSDSQTISNELSRRHLPSRMHSSDTRQHEPAPESPCFVHSLLDRGASLRNWLELNGSFSPGFTSSSSSIFSHPPHHSSSSSNTSDSGLGSSIRKQSPGSAYESSPTSLDGPNGPANGSSHVATQAASGQPSTHHQSHRAPMQRRHDVDFSSGSGSSTSGEEGLLGEDERDDGPSLTKQLAETAVGVRELSKQLGRARVRTSIQSVLIVTKARDNRLIKLTRELAIYLMKKKSAETGRGLTVYVDNQLRKSKRFDAEGIRNENPEFFVPVPRRRSSSTYMPGYPDQSGVLKGDEGQLRYWTSEMCSQNAHLFDFVVTLGGDGTVLFTSWLFQRIVPPVLPFALGSLGFLTNFDFSDYAGVMDSAIDNGIRVNLRMRFTCTVYRAVAPTEGKGRKAIKKADTGEILMKNVEEGGWEALEGGGGLPLGGPAGGKDREIMCFTTRPVETFEVLNDLVVDRGPSPYVSLLELFGDEHHMTTVQADGLTVSTPTGSTAYSLSAGGSLVHPEIPALLITPICPHTLSFRPMLLPDTMELRICVPYNSRSTAWASFDGRGRVELKQGDHIKVTASKYPFPTVCADKQSTDWFHAIARTLKWNERERQKSFVVVEEGPARQKKSSKKASQEAAPAHVSPPPVPEEAVEEDEDEDEEDEDDKFDIDDSAPEPTAATSPGGTLDPSSQDIRTSSSSDKLGGALSSSSSVKSGVQTPGRFAGVLPHPPPVGPLHMISDAAEKLKREEFERRTPQTHHQLHPSNDLKVPPNLSLPPVAVSPSNKSPEKQLEMQARGEDGQRDFIRAPETLFQSNKSKIPLDRDIEAESMRTPRPDATGAGSMPTVAADRSELPRRQDPSPDRSRHPPHAHHGVQWAQPPPARPRHHRRHASVDGGFSAPRRAFAAWGRDESDSNASDSDT